MNHVMELLDVVLLMSVNPGFGGQSFIAGTLPKLRDARARIDRWMQAGGQPILLEVDGVVKVDNIAQIRAAGADTFVAGAAIFGQLDDAAVVQSLCGALAQAVTLFASGSQARFPARAARPGHTPAHHQIGKAASGERW